MKPGGKKTFFEKLTGAMNVSDDELDEETTEKEEMKGGWMEEGGEEVGQLTIDVHQTNDDIIVQAMVAGVRPEDLEVSITRDMVTVKGKRERESKITEENYFYKELYWGSFSRTVLLPQEIDPERAEASEKNGLLTLRLPKIDKGKKRNLKVKGS